MDLIEKELSDLESAYKNAQSPTEKLNCLNDIVTRFPLLYGYWLKLIDLSTNKETEWKRALQNCQVIDLWTKFLQSSCGTSLTHAEQAVDLFGYHFHSYPLWEILIHRSNNDPEVIRRATKIPIYAYAQVYQSAFETSVATQETLEKMSSEISQKVTERWQFESQLKRPYFHPRPLDNTELESWKGYLTYIEANGIDTDDIQQLYRRCLVTTALYPEFWIKYIQWLVNNNKAYRDVLDEAIRYCPNNPQLRRLNAKSLEDEGDIANAREQLVLAETLDETPSSLRELIKFDLRNSIKPAEFSEKYAVEWARETGDLSRISEANTDAYRELFNFDNVDPRDLFDAWERGLCPDSVSYAQRLKEAGRLDLFFAVDQTLGYNL